MEKKEFQIGEVFQFGLLKLKCVKPYDIHKRCSHCFLVDCYQCMDIVGNCIHNIREDKTDVIFVKVEE